MDANLIDTVSMSVKDANNEEVYYQDDPSFEGDIHTITIPGDKIKGGDLTVEVYAADAFYEDQKETTERFTITVIDLPQFVSFTPQSNTATGDDKRPTVSVTFANAGENPTVQMKLNETVVTPVVSGNTATYTPTEDLEDGKVTVWVKITRADGKSEETTWNFTVGKATYQLYFGQLHSHTAEYSDGTGTLEQALEHAKNAERIDFLAVTDHSNYYDTKDNPNGDMTDASKGKMTTDGSKTLWQEAKETAEQYADDTFIPIIGYEMTWSGQYGHINTFNSIGFESRNVPKYVVKGGPGLVAYYDRLVEVAGTVANGLNQCLLRGTKSGSVGHGTAHHAHQVGDGDVPRNQVDGECHHDVEAHDEHGDAIEFDALVLERREEAGAYLQTNGEDEQDEAELLDELERRSIDGHAQVADKDAAKQDKGRSQRDAEEPHLAQHHADGDDDGIDQNGVCHTVADE